MTKRDYELIARTLRTYNGAYMLVAWHLADAFERDNPRFNKAKFIAACEKHSIEIKPNKTRYAK